MKRSLILAFGLAAVMAVFFASRSHYRSTLESQYRASFDASGYSRETSDKLTAMMMDSVASKFHTPWGLSRETDRIRELRIREARRRGIVP